jgi:hypothetical protein
MVKSRRNTRRRSLKRHSRRASRGGGWSMGPALSPTAYYLPEYKMYSECYPMDRPGMIQSNPNPALAQTAMAGGRRKQRGAGCACGIMRGGSRRSRTGVRGKRSRRQRGGRYMVDISQSIGGDGPNVAPMIPSIPCESHRPMSINPTSATLLSQAPSPGVEVGGLRPAFIQAGGGPAYDPAPLAYTAPRAGFTFVPNISQGQVLNPGQIPYQQVVSQHDECGSTSCAQGIQGINKY